MRNNFVFRSFSAYLRNSLQISNITLNEIEGSGVKMTDKIQKLTATVTGEKPSLILINKKDLDQRLGNAFKYVIDEVFFEDTKNPRDTKSLVVLYQGSFFKSSEIEKVLKRITTKIVNVFDPQHLGEKTSENNLIKFLSNKIKS